MVDEKCDYRLYIGNLDRRISESEVIKMFSPFGKIISEDFLWHTHGPKRGEPRGYAFIQYNTQEEAELAKAKMNGKLACGRPLVVRFAGERCPGAAPARGPGRNNDAKDRDGGPGGSGGAMSRSAKIAAIKSKLRSLEEGGTSSKRLRHSDNSALTLD